LQIRNQKDFWSGVMFTVVGLAFAAFAQQYDLGSAQRMGPAFFPTALGLLLALLGVVIGLRSLAAGTVDGKVEKFHLDVLAWILGSVVLFGALLRPAGLVVALVALIGVSAMASHEFKWKETLFVTIALVLLVLVVFIWGLKLTIPIWPSYFEY
jgi:putative tricarboxylic transport membrane protein